MLARFGKIAILCGSILLAPTQAPAQDEFTVPTIEGQPEPGAETKTVGNTVIVFYQQIRTKKRVRQLLGGFPGHQVDYCVLATVGTVHHNQACTCQVSPGSGVPNRWVLIVSLDESVNGFCRCQAYCLESKK